MDFFLPSKWEGTTIFSDRGAKVHPDQSFCDLLTDFGKRRASLQDRAKLVEEYFQSKGLAIEYHDPDKDSSNAAHPENVFFEKLCVQNAEIFRRYSLEEVRSIFAWAPEVLNSDLFRRMKELQGTYSVAHLRRGDIANIELNHKRDTGYSVISRASYKRAFQKFGVDPDKVIWVSDDRTGAWGVPKNRVKPAGWSYPEGSHPIGNGFYDWFEDFLLIYFAKSVFRANSSFSWWAACLNATGTVYSPVLTERRNYLKPGDEIEVDFIEGNHPHWLNLQNGKALQNIHIAP